MWSTASRLAIATLRAGAQIAYSGDLVQVSRLGNPLVNEAVIDLGAQGRVQRASSRPATRRRSIASLDPEVPKLLNLIFGVDRRRRRATIW